MSYAKQGRDAIKNIVLRTPEMRAEFRNHMKNIQCLDCREGLEVIFRFCHGYKRMDAILAEAPPTERRALLESSKEEDTMRGFPSMGGRHTDPSRYTGSIDFNDRDYFRSDYPLRDGPSGREGFSRGSDDPFGFDPRDGGRHGRDRHNDGGVGASRREEAHYGEGGGRHGGDRHGGDRHGRNHYAADRKGGGHPPHFDKHVTVESANESECSDWY